MNLKDGYFKALRGAAPKLRSGERPRGMETDLQECLAKEYPDSRREVPLEEIEGVTIFGKSNGRVDLLISGHGIEAKVVRLPRKKANPNNALYDIGQLSADYWRLANSQLESADLLVLLYGPLVRELQTPTFVYREFHNRMFLDFRTSIEFGELAREKHTSHRKKQIDAISSMSLDKPCNISRWAKVVDEFALVSIPVVMMAGA